MKIIKQILKSIYHLTKVMLSFVKFLLLLLWNKSYRNPIKSTYKGTLCLLANGPSLKKVLERITIDNEFKNVDFIVMNYFSRDALFWKIKPKHYCFADPIFFQESSRTQESIDMYATWNKIDWDINVYVPKNIKKQFIKFAKITNPNIHVVGVNTVTYYGYERFRNFFYKKGLSMPESQTVAIMTIYVAIQLGYSIIRLYGVDHSYTASLVVNEKNQLCRRYEHFYKDNEAELRPINPPIDMMSFFFVLTKVFDGHKKLASFGKYMHIKILNCTKDSYIDSYDRE